jgi:glucose/arabinose dehydrogenase
MRKSSWSKLSGAAVVCLQLLLPRHGLDAQDFPCEGVTPVGGESVTLEEVSSVLERPVDVQAPPGDTARLFVVEQRGRIQIIELDNADSIRSTPFLDIRANTDDPVNDPLPPAANRRVLCCGEQGLLGLAFHPDYADNGYFFVNYSRSTDGQNIIARFQVSAGDDNLADPASHTLILAVPGFESNHNSGQLAFGPLDGYLYVATGDGGGGCDGHGTVGNGQNPQSLLGKILRLDIDGGAPYAIPATNPFDAGGDGILDEIWTMGLRNPWRFAFDPENGDMYIGDVGQDQWEEIDYEPGGGAGGFNYGWRRLEGTRFSSVSGCSVVALGPGTAAAPILEYPHTSQTTYTGRSVTGGVVYRGCRMPDLHGTYFFADYATHFVRSFRVVNGNVVGDLRNRTDELNAAILPADRLDDLSSFGVDGRGEIYICDLSTKLFRIIPATTTNAPPVARITTDPSPPAVTLVGGAANILLDGTTSSDGGDGPAVLAYHWEKTSGPDGDTIARVDKESTGITFTATGDYTYLLTVNDGADADTDQVTVTVSLPPEPTFRRGDSNGDGLYDVSDAVYALNHLFLGSPVEVPCKDALDADGDGEVILTDAVFYLNNRFLGGPEIPAPHPDCGTDPTPEDPLGCPDGQTACVEG